MNWILDENGGDLINLKYVTDIYKNDFENDGRVTYEIDCCTVYVGGNANTGLTLASFADKAQRDAAFERLTSRLADGGTVFRAND